MIDKNIIVSDIKNLFLGSAAKQFGRFLYSYAAAFYLGPHRFGLWQGVRLILNYGTYINLGTIYGLERNIPYYIGKGDQDRVKRTESTILIFNLAITTLLSLITIGYGLWYSGDKELKLAIIFIGFILWVWLVQSYYLFIVRAHQRFDIIPIVGGVDLVCSLSAIVLVIYFGFLGFLVGFFLRGLLSLIMVVHLANSPLPTVWDFGIFKENLSYGFPLMLGGLFVVLFDSIDKIVILAYLDTEQLGFYSLGTLIVLPLGMVINSVNNVLFPKMSVQYGSRGDVAETGRFVEKSYAIVGRISPLLIGLVHINLIFIVQVFLPKYLTGVSAASILIYGLLFSHLSGIFDRFWVTIGRQKLVLGIAIFGCLVKIGASLGALHLGFGITGIAFASLFSYTFIFLLMAWVSFRMLKFSGLQACTKIFFMLVRVAYVAGASSACVALFGFDSGGVDYLTNIITSIKQHLLYGAMTLPLILVLLRDPDIAQHLPQAFRRLMT